MNSQSTLSTGTTITNLLFVAFALCTFTTAQAQDRLVIKGNISSQSNSERAGEAVLIASDGEQMRMDVSKRGHYMVNVPAKDSYILRFTKNGCVTKEVAVDGHYANINNYGERTVRLDVTLEAQDLNDPMHYNGPAVEVSFTQMGRDLRIEAQNELTPMVAFNDHAVNAE